MPPKRQPDRTICRHCKVDYGDPTKLSPKGSCLDCSVGRMIENMQQMHKGEGPNVEKWKINTATAILTGNTKRKAIEQRKRERADAKAAKAKAPT